MTPSMQSYLEAKRTVDDRALNRRVFEQFTAELAEIDEPVRVTEFGCGVGTMVSRLVEWECLPTRTRYHAIDRDPESVVAARKRLPDRLEAAGYRIVDGSDVPEAERREDGLETTVDARSRDRRIDLSLEVADALSTATGDDGDRSTGPEPDDARSRVSGSDDARSRGTGTADAVIAAAFLDVVDLDRALDAASTRLEPGGLLYAPITFDGATGFAPPHPLDERIERLYHRHMDDVRDRDGGSTTGRQLLSALPANGFELLATGGSDWIVRPRSGESGGYPATEQVFLEAILETIDDALAAYPATVLDPSDRTTWVSTRRRQLEAAELSFVSHHLDVLARLEKRRTKK
ncbi:class I SAM-dependent methyltransferase [Natrarchaeobius chitinivorans]|uniref:Class I SAM-dependent methyltransferase n=1 Tax=Natrarchaeobius chitinivorans TaxID=1679083 RepID=A0A3N6PEZ1_NATCH|nr:class I SAM-dependent methyltransferase [Natrarchaeobius chitinivorans]RQG95995.1 class I SAM-dependent methyltransferase [Natrarchaeobius chitinivorans]